MTWIKIHIEHLRRWREYAASIAAAACKLYPGATIYVVGSIAAGKPTVLSDIDVLIVIPSPQVRPEDKPRIAARIFEVAVEEYGLPWDAPVEIHIASPREARRYLETSRHVRVRECAGHGGEDE